MAGGSHDANHVSVASDTLGGTLTEENQIVVCDMPIDNPVGDEPMNDVVVPLNDVTVAACNMPFTDVTPVTTAIIMLPTRKFFSGNLRSLHPGKSSILTSKTTPLLRWIFEHREQGVQVTTRMVRKVAEDIVPNFCEKTIVAKNQVVRRFLHRVGLTHRVATHVAQKSHHETEAASIEFMEFMRQKVANMNPDHVINMDQTPIPFSYHFHAISIPFLIFSIPFPFCYHSISISFIQPQIHQTRFLSILKIIFSYSILSILLALAVFLLEATGD